MSLELIVKNLKEQHRQMTKQARQLAKAIDILDGRSFRQTVPDVRGKSRRHMSAATRRKIGKAALHENS